MSGNVKMKFIKIIILSFVVFSKTALATDQNTLDELDRQNQLQTEIELRRTGLTDLDAKWAAWSIYHQPTSRCGQVALTLVGGYNPFENAAIMKIENYKLCTPQSLIADAKSIKPSNEIEKKFIKDKWGIDWDKQNPNSGLNIKIKYPEEALEENRGGEVHLTCNVREISKEIWKPYNCLVNNSIGGDDFVSSTMDFLSKVLWRTEDLPAKPNASGKINFVQKFSVN